MMSVIQKYIISAKQRLVIGRAVGRSHTATIRLRYETARNHNE